MKETEKLTDLPVTKLKRQKINTDSGYQEISKAIGYPVVGSSQRLIDKAGKIRRVEAILADGRILAMYEETTPDLSLEEEIEERIIRWRVAARKLKE